MKDKIVEALCDFATNTSSDLEQDVRHEVTRRTLDVVGIALGSIDEPAPAAVRRYLLANYPDGPSRVWGTSLKSTPQAAAIANGAAVRCLDFNDGYMTPRDGGHPSDMIPGIIGVAEKYRSSGGDVAAAISIAYDVFNAISGAVAARRNGWDHVGVLGIGAVCGAGRLMGLTPDQLREAVSITAIAHNALRQSRYDHLTMWKSIAAGYAISNAIESCLLAAADIEGPSAAFEGTSGYIQVLGKDDFDSEYFYSALGGSRAGSIRRAAIKVWPLGQLAQCSVDVAVKLHKQIDDLGQVDRIHISTFDVAADVMDGPEKWAPTTRESADHSLVYATVAGLYDGYVTHETFKEDRLESSGFKDILREKVSLEVRDDFSERYPECQMARVEVRLKDGREYTEESAYPRGHFGNKASDDELTEKFRRLAEPVLGQRTDALLEILKTFPGMANIRDLTDQLVL